MPITNYTSSPSTYVDDEFRRRTVAPHNDPMNTQFDGDPRGYGASITTYPGSRMVAPDRPMPQAMPSPIVTGAPSPMDFAPPPMARYEPPPPTLPEAVPAQAEERVRSGFSQAMADRRAAGDMIQGPAEIPFDQHPAADIFQRYLNVVNPQPQEPTGIERALALMDAPPPATSPARRMSSGSGSGSRSSGQRSGGKSAMYTQAREHAERSTSRSRRRDNDDRDDDRDEPNTNSRSRSRRRFRSY